MDNTFFGRKDIISQSIAKSVAEVVKTETQNFNSYAASYIEAKCGVSCEEKCKKDCAGFGSDCIAKCKSSPDYTNCLLNTQCFKCLNTFLDKDQILGDNYIKNKSTIDMLRNSACFGMCSCTLENLSLTNNILINASSTIQTLNDTQIKQVADLTLKDLGEKYDSMQGVDKDTIIQLISTIRENISKEINQDVTAIQGVYLQGAGITVKNLTMTLTINATLRAIASSDTAINILDQIVQEQMDWITKKVNEDFTDEFKRAFQQSKMYLIVTGIIFAVLLSTVVGLLIYRAAVNP